jgi:ribosomal protein L11 methyltransferase
MVEIRIGITAALSEALEAYFCEELQQHWLIFQHEAEGACSLRGYFDDEASAVAALRELAAEVEGLEIEGHTCLPVEDQDWKLAYRFHLRPWSCGRLHWVPSWERETYAVPAEGRAVYLDSGMAFGTGSHETTRLCAEAMVAHASAQGGDVSGLYLMDAGCGSGILALSAVALGYGTVEAFDRDPVAVEVTAENLRENGLEGSVGLRECGIEEGVSGRFADVLVANIQADVLMIYADNLVKACRPGGTLILSGILAQERERVADAFSDMVERLFGALPTRSSWAQQGDWVALVFELPSCSA